MNIDSMTRNVKAALSSISDKNTFIAIGAIAGGLLGQGAIPIPVLGGVVGAAAGGYIAYRVYNTAANIYAGLGGIVRSIVDLIKPLAILIKNMVFIPFKIISFILYPLSRAAHFINEKVFKRSPPQDLPVAQSAPTVLATVIQTPVAGVAAADNSAIREVVDNIRSGGRVVCRNPFRVIGSFGYSGVMGLGRFALSGAQTVGEMIKDRYSLSNI